VELTPRLEHAPQQVLGLQKNSSDAERYWIATGFQLIGDNSIAETQYKVIESSCIAISQAYPLKATRGHRFVNNARA
jgi:hypothetical protein